MKASLVATLVVFGWMSSPAWSITVHQSDDFQDLTVAGWVSGGNNPNPPVVAVDAGPDGAGDHALLVYANGNPTSPGNKLTFFNNQQWTGDYNAAGISRIRFDVNNLSNFDVPLGLLFEGPSGGATTNNGVTVPAQSGWQSMFIDFPVSNLVGTDPAATLSAVSRLRIKTILNGNEVVFDEPHLLRFDNITAIPEPTSAMLMLGVVGTFAASRRYRRRCPLFSRT